MKIEFACTEDRDQFYAMLDAVYGLDHIQDQTNALNEADKPGEMLDALAYRDALLRIKNEHIQRMQSFLRVFMTVVRLARRCDDSDGKLALSGGTAFDLNDLSRIWNGAITVGMIHRESSDKERPWASTWEGHS